MTRIIALCVVSICISGAAEAQRAPSATFQVSGGVGNWLLDFNLTNHFNLGEGQLYFFGVRLETGRNVVNGPEQWNYQLWATWNNASAGGSSLLYNNNWITPGLSESPFVVREANSKAGFLAIYTGNDAPVSVPFFCYGQGDLGNGYQGF